MNAITKDGWVPHASIKYKYSFFGERFCFGVSGWGCGGGGGGGTFIGSQQMQAG